MDRPGPVAGIHGKLAARGLPCLWYTRCSGAPASEPAVPDAGGRPCQYAEKPVSSLPTISFWISVVPSGIVMVRASR